MNLPLDAIAVQYALLFLSLGLFFAFLLVMAVLVETVNDWLRLDEWLL